jgi:hypothetical protein
MLGLHAPDLFENGKPRKNRSIFEYSASGKFLTPPKKR